MYLCKKGQKFGQKFFKKISTHLLTVLVISVIVQLEQRKGVQKGAALRKNRTSPMFREHNTSDFSDSANNEQHMIF